MRSCGRMAPSVCAHVGLSQVMFPGPGAGCSLRGSADGPHILAHKGRGNLLVRLLPVSQLPFFFSCLVTVQVTLLSASPGQVGHLQITTSEHLSYERCSLEAALSILITAVLTTLLAVFPFRLLMWLLPEEPLYCLGKRAGTSAADRWDSHRTIPRWQNSRAFQVWVRL